ncbi:unnamed protein product [Blepharisma stoltei]|uniref:Uncharacterized protein n=1 Tax=Blepharisma stoltei TaxID=1481888 RepID=A0AAU9IT89_9CILI|nr:unnamed protein product [Blepharisma stoltei]
MNTGEHSGNLIADIKNFILKTPVFTKFVLIISTLLYILTLIRAIILSSNIQATALISYFQIWQYYLTPFLWAYFIFELAIYWIIASITERRIGTVRYSIFFIINSTLLQFMYLILVLTFSLAPIWINSGFFYILYPSLWSVLMMEITITFNKNPYYIHKIPHLSWEIKNFIIPWIIFVVLSLLFPVLLRLIAGLILGYLYIRKHLSCMELSDAKVEELENSSVFRYLKSFSTFISYQSVQELPIGNEPFLGIQTINRPVSPLSQSDHEYELLEGNDEFTSEVEIKTDK